MNKCFSVLLLAATLLTSCSGQVQNQAARSASVPADLSRQSRMGKPLIQDKAGNLWFSTAREGVYRYDGKTFTNFTEKDGLSNNAVFTILEDSAGKLWFGTADG